MKLALVHDWLNQVGGAEDVLADLIALYPAAPIYTSIYAPARMPPALRGRDIRTLWLDRLPGIHDHHQPYLPLYPLGWGGLDLSAYDVILSNKSGFCHGVGHGPETLHVCYCLAPTRYVWQFESYVQREALGPAQVALLRPLIAALRRWDRAAADRVDHFIAISTEIQERIRRFYGRESTIIYPPVDTARFQPVPPEEVEDYFLVVSRHVPYKRLDLAVQACTALGLPLKVGGRGRDTERLQARADGRVPGLHPGGRTARPDGPLPGLPLSGAGRLRDRAATGQRRRAAGDRLRRRRRAGHRDPRRDRRALPGADGGKSGGGPARLRGRPLRSGRDARPRPQV